MNDNGHIIGIDIGGTNFRVGQVSCKGEVGNVQLMPSKFLAEADDSVQQIGRASWRETV